MPGDMDMFNEDVNDILNEELEKPTEKDNDGKGKREGDSNSEPGAGDGSEEEIPDEEVEEETEDEGADGDDEKPIEFSDGEDNELDPEIVESAPVDINELNKKYPKLLKEFPAIGKAFVREQKFTELFPTIEDAQEAHDRSESFRNFEQEIFSGQSKRLLSHIAQQNPKGFEKFTGNFLATIREVNPQQFQNIVGPEIIKVIKYVGAQAKKHGDTNLGTAAKYFSHYLFDKNDPDELELPTITKEDTESEERVRLQQERQKFNKERYDVAVNDVSQQIDDRLNEAIAKDLDPNNRFSEFHRKAIVERVIKDIYKNLDNSELHKKTMRGLWERSAKASHSAEWRNKIRDTYLFQALKLMPQLRSKRKEEASKSLKPGSVNKNNLPSGRAGGERRASTNGSGKSGKAIDWNKTSDKDIFEGKETYRK